jgi:hypothetical protein
LRLLCVAEETLRFARHGLAAGSPLCRSGESVENPIDEVQHLILAKPNVDLSASDGRGL